ncbi:hypothetical protein FHL15_007470 [Xylaria flabelliformis]|uniref:Uncharacterized protein n=1 Tax=Xylaria flabelliformis TaxID=2512241 RepID=A0A553HUR2_9PEZI|nr:hypothetical protein FHL15_007470 [Xylaria flabelliformis]
MHTVLDDKALDFSNEAKDDVSKNPEDGISSYTDALINQGENLRSRTNHRKPALHYASINCYKRVDMIKPLQNSGTREIVSLKDDNDRTLLYYAAKSNFAEGIKLLVEYGAHIDILNNHGFSPYLWTVNAAGLGTTRILLSLGVDVSSTSADGKSALAAASGDWITDHGRLREKDCTVPRCCLGEECGFHIIPAGETWEKFIPDNMILQRLRQAGYRKPELDHLFELLEFNRERFYYSEEAYQFSRVFMLESFIDQRRKKREDEPGDKHREKIEVRLREGEERVAQMLAYIGKPVPEGAKYDAKQLEERYRA